jgi:hypothetical protein
MYNLTIKKVLDSIRPIIKNLKYVRINNDAIERFIESLKKEEFNQSEYEAAGSELNSKDQLDHIALTIVYNTLNFCYWGNPKWTITVKDKEIDGSYAMTHALIRGIEEGYALLDPKYLSRIPEKDLREIFRGNTDIPLFKERLKMLRSLGKTTQKKFAGDWMKIIETGNFDAVGVVEVLAGSFPDIFDDKANYDNNIIYFYKRAQLIPAYIGNDLYKNGLVNIQITNLSKLTAFADYKVPQLLRKYGLISYNKELAEKIDAMVELPEGSKEEIEIRAATIEVVERITNKAKERFPQATPSIIDGIIWFRGQIKSPTDKPYHRTKTIWY